MMNAPAEKNKPKTRAFHYANLFSTMKLIPLLENDFKKQMFCYVALKCINGGVGQERMTPLRVRRLSRSAF